MHLVQDQDRYLEADKKGLPFFYTLCNSVEPMGDMTTERGMVDCSKCLALAPRPEAPIVAAKEEKPNLDDFTDFADLEADLGSLDSVDPEPGAEEAPAEEPSPLGDLGPMLDMVLAGFEPEYDSLDRWAMDPSSDDVLGSGEVDIRTLLRPDELEFVTKLVGLSKMIGIEGLATRVVAILHRVLDESGAPVE